MRTILVIEDEAQTRNIFLKSLNFEGFKALGASHGSMGLALAQEHLPDLIICDITMPDMDGYSVLSALRRLQATAAIPFIFLTAKVTMGDLRKGMDMGADDYLTKPCTVEQFLSAIHSRLKRHTEVARGLHETVGLSSITQDVNNGLEPCFPDSPHLNAVFQFIEVHFLQPIQLAEVAQAVGYSPAYLTNLMKEQTGRTIKQWIIERRMHRARSLLATTSSPIKQVAESSGYSDAGYFTRQFRQTHQLSPQEWRQKSVSNVTNKGLINNI